MTSGGYRTQSGPKPNPNSGRSERRNFTLTSLPSEGYTGKVPAFPLMERPVLVMSFDDQGGKKMVTDEELTEDVADREQELWEWAWSTPQACAWSLEPWRWQTVAMWVRTFVICEGHEAKAADKGALLRLQDQIGLSPAGLIANGWAIARDELAEKSATKKPIASSGGSRSRMQVVPGVG